MQRSWRAHAFIVASLAVQIALPLRSLVLSRFNTDPEWSLPFSWNMYAVSVPHVADYRVVRADGSSFRLSLQRRSGGAYGMARLMRRDRLPYYNAWLCEQVRRSGESGRLIGHVRLVPRSGPARTLVPHGTEICQAPNYGVMAE